MRPESDKKWWREVAKPFRGDLEDLTSSQREHNRRYWAAIEDCDPTEDTRREMIESGQVQRDLAVANQRWTTEELQRDFIVHGFLAPFIAVTRKSDGKKGSLEFSHSPRIYFNFVPD